MAEGADKVRIRHRIKLPSGEDHEHVEFVTKGDIGRGKGERNKIGSCTERKISGMASY